MKKFILIFWLLTIYANAQSLGNMYFLNEDIGWIQSGVTTYYFSPENSYRTNDSGKTWILLNNKYHYKNIQFVNDSTGFLISISQNLFKTIDKGETWEFLADSVIQAEFANNNIGYIMDDMNRLFITTNGGFSWKFIKNTSAYILKGISKNRVSIIEETYSRKNNFLLSLDNGETWDTSIILPFSNHTVRQINFTDSLRGFALVLQSDPQGEYLGNLRRTTDGGLTWSWDTLGEYVHMISMKENSSSGAAWGWWEFYITKDGFNTWETKFSDSLARNYFYLGCEAFYVCGDSNYFAKSTNCGDTWTKIPFVVHNPTDVDELNTTNTKYSLEQNYPNPFNPSTRINYNLLINGITTIKIYDILGKEIVTLLNEYQTSGSHYVDYNASNLNSGVYFYKVTSGEFTDVKKMVFIK